MQFVFFDHQGICGIVRSIIWNLMYGHEMYNTEMYSDPLDPHRWDEYKKLEKWRQEHPVEVDMSLKFYTQYCRCKDPDCKIKKVILDKQLGK